MEVLVVCAALVLIFGFAAGTFLVMSQRTDVNEAAQEIVETLRLAQNKTLASEGSSSFGVNFETSKFTLFRGAVFSEADPDNQVHNLSPKISISEINLNGGSAVVFERLSGTTGNQGHLKIQNIDGAQNQNIFIDNSGTVDLVLNSSNDDNRLKDSRHAHVVFSQNTKTAATLALYFPADSFTQNINYQDFLNTPQNEFFWEEDVVVGGQTQHLKIHTHSLTDQATNFCFHLDRRVNSKAVSISLDGQNLINYSATGAVSAGSSAWAGPPQIQ